MQIEEIVENHSKGVYTLALRLCGNKPDAEDLFQNTFLKIAERGSLNKEQNIKSYLYTTALNLYRKKYNKKKRQIVSYIEDEEYSELPSGAETAEAMYIDNARQKAIREFINQLEDKYRIPVLLFYERELTVSEIARYTKTPSGTIKTRLKKAREMIKKRLEEANWII